MLFNSLQFLYFFIVVTFVYFLLPHRFRWIHLLVASCIFYCAFIPVYILILFFTIAIDYAAGILIEGTTGRRKRFYLLASLVANLGVLGFFKYFNFFIDNINVLLHSLQVQTYPLQHLGIILPIGLSFHTFQAMSYTIEIYRGKQRAERHLGIYSLYVMFYPQLVAGPIERPQNIIPQLREEKKFDFNDAVSGLQQMVWGLFKKVAVADQLAIYVNSIYNNWELNSGLTLVVASYAFAFQIYCDFSGYSDIAQGAARTMGFRLMDNFHLPYFSKTITEFWRRWHISLSSWLKDYLYISLGGNRLGQFRTGLNLFITMVLGGLWHGASWNFVIWGLLNGLYLTVEKFFSITVSRKFLIRGLQLFATFNLISLTWIFFRSTSFQQAIGILKNIMITDHFWNIRIQDTGVFASMVLTTVLLLVFEYFGLRKKNVTTFFEHRSIPQSIAWIVLFGFLIILFGVSNGDQFIYFQF